jgi:hypothetical protein
MLWNMNDPATPEDLVDVLVGGSNPLVEDWERVRAVVQSNPARVDGLRDGLNGSRERRWATAVVLAHLGAADGDDLARDVMSEFDWTLIPGPAYHYWEQAAWHLQDAFGDGRQVPGVRDLALDALRRADMDAGEWTDVVDEAIALLSYIPLDAETKAALARVAAEHWDTGRRESAQEILETPRA